jgi:hypothetical protein
MLKKNGEDEFDPSCEKVLRKSQAGNERPTFNQTKEV